MTRPAVSRSLEWLAVALLFALPGRAADPHLDWFTFRTAHFSVHYHTGGEAFARRAAATAEEAYGVLTSSLGWLPIDDTIHVVCTDQSDGANGFARVEPYDGMTLQAFSPEADTDLDAYDDWLRLLVYHELTHVLHLDQVSGAPTWVNAVLGKTIMPNLAHPSWFIEGLATWVESTYIPRGRVRSASFEMYLRAAWLGGTLPESIGGLTGDPLNRPGATWAYAFGSRFVTWIIERHGVEALKDYVRRYGNRILPYGLNNVARAAFGEDFVKMFHQWRENYVLRVTNRVFAERDLGIIEGIRLTTAGHVHHAPAWAPDGRSFAL